MSHCGYGEGQDGKVCGKPATVVFHKHPRWIVQILWYSCAEHEAKVRRIFEREGFAAEAKR